MTDGVRTPLRGMRWWRRRRFIKAYRILRNESERHTKAGHNMHFVAVNEGYLLMQCYKCPELLP